MKRHVFVVVVIFIFILRFSVNVVGANFYTSSSGGNSGAGASWSTACNGAGGFTIPSTASDNVFICQKTITVNSSKTWGAITINGGTLSIPSGYTITCSSITMSSGTLTVNGTLNITGSFTKTGGTFTAPTTATGTVGYTGGTQTVLSGITYYNLNIAGTGNKSLSTGTTTVYNQLILTSNNLIIGSNTLQVGGASWGNGTPISVSSGQLDITAGTGNLSIGGGNSLNYPTLSSWFSSAAPWTLASLTIMRNLVNIVADGNLTITGAFTTYNGSTSMGGNLKINPGVTVTFNGPVNMNRDCYCNEVTGSSTSDIIIGGTTGQYAAIYFDLGSTGIGGTNTIRNFTLNRTGMTFYPLSNLRIGNLLTLAANTKFSIANNTGGESRLNTLTFDGADLSWTGSGKFVGSADLTSAYIYIYGSGTLSTPLTFETGTAANYTLTGLEIQRSGSPVLQLGTPLNILSFINFKPGLSTYGSLDINGKIINLGTSGAILNENTSESIFCSTCVENSTTSFITATQTLAAGTTYDYSTDGRIGNTGLRGLGLDIVTSGVAPGITTINRGFSIRSGNELSTSVKRYFEISPTTNTGLNTTLTFHYWDSEGNGLTESENGLYRDNTGTNFWVSRGGVSNPGSGDNTVVLTAIDQFSPWTVGKNNEPVPVRLLFFDATCDNYKILLNWSTASEINCDNFIIEKSSDTKTWTKIGSLAGAGNSNHLINYSFSDENLFEETVYYRLKQVDYDGAFSFYGPVAAGCSKNYDDMEIQVYPNPTAGKVYVQAAIDAPGSILLCDIIGKTIAEYHQNNLSQPFEISMEDVPPGIYMIRVVTEGFSKNYKIVRK